MPTPLVFQGKFTENYFKELCLPKIQFQLLGGRFLNLLPYMRMLINCNLLRNIAENQHCESMIQVNDSKGLESKIKAKAVHIHRKFSGR